jgi:hypothetical protein
MLVLRSLVKAEEVSAVVKARGGKAEEAEEAVVPRAATVGNPLFEIILNLLLACKPANPVAGFFTSYHFHSSVIRKGAIIIV